MIRFHVLGAGGAVPTSSHTPAAYFVEIDGHRILLDPGPGALVRLVKSPVGHEGLDIIDEVLLSHLHPDHCADLVPLLFALHSPVLARTDRLPLGGPTGLVRYLERLTDLYGSWLEPRNRRLIIQEINPGQTLELPHGATATAFAVEHEQDRLAEFCLGYRFQDSRGNSAVFSGDTGPSTGLTEAARSADLLIVECSTPDELATAGHLTPGQVGDLCAAARPRQTVLTHQYPAAAALDLAALVGAKWSGPVIQATDGCVVTVEDDSQIRKEEPDDFS